MKKGRYICDTLKTIRKQVADANDIHYEPRECTHEGDCLGTCPACEAEVRYLENELNMRRQLGKAVALVGISAGLAGLTGCGSKKPIIDPHPALAGIPVMPPIEVVDPPQPVEKIDTLHPVATTEDNKIFGDASEQMPMFRGGDRALMEYLEQNVRYPEDFEGCAQGRVVVQIVIDEAGNVTNPTVVKSLAPELDKEALRVVGNMPKWRPGKVNGKSCKVKYTIPVTFKLK